MYILYVLLVVVAAALLYARKIVKDDEERRNGRPRLVSNTGEELELPEEFSDLLPVTILYGTQTGNAMCFAEELETEGPKFGFNVKIEDLEEFDPDQLQFQECVVMIVATYGEGDPTDSAIEFTEWLLEEERNEDTDLQEMPYCVFGLGNRQYEFFNKQGKVVDKRLEELGASRFLELGASDDDGNIDDDWMEWKHKFWAEIVVRFGLEMNDVDEVDEFEGHFRIIFHDDEDDLKKEEVELEHSQTATIVVNRELRNTEEEKTGESTRHIEIDISGTELTYITADNLEIYPRNDYKTVARICKSLDLDPDSVFSLRALDPQKGKKLPINSPVSLRDAFLWRYDLTGSPKRKFVGYMAQYAENEEEKEELAALGAGKGEFKDMFTELFHHQRLNVADLLERYPSIVVPVEHLLEMLPHLQPRAYTISSSNQIYPDRVHVTLSVVRDKLDDDSLWFGVTSDYLKDLRPEKDQVRVLIRPSTFRLPDPIDSAPVIMIGPGSGIAPMRAFVQDGMDAMKKGVQLKDWMLFFGCRHQDMDYLYREELEEASEAGVLTDLIVAFSRMQAEKVYVQHKVEENSQRLWDLIGNNGAYVYVCGGTGMGRDIRELMKQIFRTEGGLSEEDAAKMLADLQNNGRYVQELWG